MRLVLVLVVSISFLGCSAEATETSSVTPPPITQVEEAAAGGALTGRVVEALDVASYTYLRLATPVDGEVWAAVPKAALEVGSEVILQNPQAMYSFESKTLGRTFERIYFATLAGPSSPSKSNPHANLGAGTAGLVSGRASAAAPTTGEKVAKAEGATGVTVAELYAQKSDLSGAVITLRGRVVKYAPSIMGKNWFHIQDGTGDANDETHDITVTSAATTAVGEIVVIQGTVAVDKDFGAGYRYAVIVEDAVVQ